jgi:hypothetical protein
MVYSKVLILFSSCTLLLVHAQGQSYTLTSGCKRTPQRVYNPHRIQQNFTIYAPLKLTIIHLQGKYTALVFILASPLCMLDGTSKALY